MKQQYLSNAYLLLDNSAGGESRWDMNGREVEHGVESNGFQNLRLETDVETTTVLIKTELENVYDNGYHWSMPTSSYLDTPTTTLTYRENSSSTFWQTTTIDYPFWDKQTAAAKSSAFTATTTPLVHEVISDASEEAIKKQPYVTTPAQSPKVHQPLALPMNTCPHRFDAVTRGKL